MGDLYLGPALETARREGFEQSWATSASSSASSAIARRHWVLRPSRWRRGLARRVLVSMLIVLISDTHGYFDPRLPDVFRGVERILHAGDIGSSTSSSVWKR